MIYMERKVTFKNNQLKMAGLMFLPEGFDEGKKYPAIVISNPAGAVKEQSPALYGRKIAEKGFIALAFDTSHQGESEGLPRQLENPPERVEDIRCAVDYLVTLPFVDTDRIGAMGICSGGGYSANVAMTERRIKAVVGVSSTDPGSWIRNGLDEKNPTPVEEQIKILEAISQERTNIAKGAEPLYGPFVPDEVTDDMAVTLKEAHEYYRTPRGSHPNSTNKVLLVGGQRLVEFDCFNLTETLLTQPLLLIAGSKADTLYFSKQLIERAASKDKELFIIEGATHVDMYDREQYVNQAIEKIAVFFNEKM